MKLEVTVEELRKYSLFVGVPMYGGQCSGMFCRSTNDLATICTKYGIELRFYYLFNESLVQRARNYITDEFMRSNCTHLMFIDSDIGFNAKDVLSLLALQTSDPEKYGVVCGPYPKKTIAWEKIKMAVENGKVDNNPFELEYYAADYVFNPVIGTTSFMISEPLEISEGGTGFMLIPRKTFEDYRKMFPEFLYLPDHARTENFDGSREIMAYFDCIIDPESKRYLSEDYFFCRYAAKAGARIWICPWMKLQHVGTYIFKGSFEALASIGTTPTASNMSNPKSYYKSKTELTKQKPKPRTQLMKPKK